MPIFTIIMYIINMFNTGNVMMSLYNSRLRTVGPEKQIKQHVLVLLESVQV